MTFINEPFGFQEIEEKTTNVRMKLGQINEIDSQIQNRTIRLHRKMHQSTKSQLSSTKPSIVTRLPKFPFLPYFLIYQTQQNQKNSPRNQKRRMERHETWRFTRTLPAKEQR